MVGWSVCCQFQCYIEQPRILLTVTNHSFVGDCWIECFPTWTAPDIGFASCMVVPISRAPVLAVFLLCVRLHDGIIFMAINSPTKPDS